MPVEAGCWGLAQAKAESRTQLGLCTAIGPVGCYPQGPSQEPIQEPSQDTSSQDRAVQGHSECTLSKMLAGEATAQDHRVYL